MTMRPNLMHSVPSGPKPRGYEVIEAVSTWEPVEATRDTILTWARANGCYRPGVTLGDINAGRRALGLPQFVLLHRVRIEARLPSPQCGDPAPDSYSKKVPLHAA